MEGGESGVSRVGALDRLFELHLIAKENKVLCASSHRHGVGQRYLSGFINEKEIEDSFPLGPGKEPGRSAYDTSRVDSTGISRFLDVPQATIGREQGAFGFTTDFDSLKTLARSLRRFAGGGEKIHHGLMAIGCDSDIFACGEERCDLRFEITEW